MGEYSLYVGSAFAISLLILVMYFLVVIKQSYAIKRELAEDQRTMRDNNGAR